MRVSIFVEMAGGFNSRLLYNILSLFSINVTDCGSKVFIYGECSPKQAKEVFFYCMLFGDISATTKLIRGDEYGEEKKESSEAHD